MASVKLSRKLSNPVHAQRILYNLNNNRESGYLCDGVIIIEGQNIQIQKCILSAASQYFRALFEYNQSSLITKDGKTIIDLSALDLEIDALHAIIDYIYTSEISLNSDNVVEILRTADIFLLAELKSDCCEFLQESLTPQNCLGIWDIARQLSCEWLTFKISAFLGDNFRAIQYTDEFLKQPPDKLQALLSLDDIEVFCEEEILDSVIRWHSHSPAERRDTLDVALLGVRFHRISDHYLHFRGMQPGLKEINFENLCQDIKQKQTEKNSRGNANVIVVTGKRNNRDNNTATQNSSVFFTLIPPSDSLCSDPTWKKLPPMNTTARFPRLVEAGGCLYAVGGQDCSGKPVSTGEKFDPKTLKWTSITPMDQACKLCGLVSVEDTLYALTAGGDMKAYKIYTNTWRKLPGINIKRNNTAMASCDKKIFVIGGESTEKMENTENTEEQRKYYETVECFDIRTETWCSVSPMRERRSLSSAVAAQGNIFVFGGSRIFGCPAASNLISVRNSPLMKFCLSEQYIPERDCWIPFPIQCPAMCTMTMDSFVSGALFDGNQILVVGNLQGTSGYSSVRAFGLDMNGWRIVTSRPLPDHPAFTSCALLKLPKCFLEQWGESSVS